MTINTENDIVEVYEHLDPFGKRVWDWRRIDEANKKIVSTSHSQGYNDGGYALTAAMAYNQDLSEVAFSQLPLD